MEDQLRTVLVRCSCLDRPGITTGLLAVLADAGAQLYDMEQVVVRERLTLDLLIGISTGDNVLKELLFHGWEHGLQLEFEVVDTPPTPQHQARSIVTVIGQAMSPGALAAVTRAIADGGGNIDRIVRLSRYPVVSYEFVVAGGTIEHMRAALIDAAASQRIDVAIQEASLEHRAKRLVLLDVDSTLIQDEVIDMLADEAGCGDQVGEITRQAMNGELDFATALRQRVALLEGAPATIIDRTNERIRLTPGARTFIRTLKRLGYVVALVSGGFTVFTDRLAADLGIDHAVANTLEVVDGRLTGRLVGELIDRAGKAAVLERIAREQNIPLSQTVAVGDGANDLDMLAIAGLGIAFNAKATVKERADTALSVPYLDAVLFLLGIRRDEVEAADAADPSLELDGLVPVPGIPPI